MKIFVDGWFTSVVRRPYTFYDDIGTIPTDCDIIAITFYNSDYESHTKTIQQLRQRCRHLVVTIKEPTQTTSWTLKRFLLENQYPDVFFFGDAMLNYDVANWQPVISWFMAPENVYVTRSWAPGLLAQLTSWQQKTPRYWLDALLGTVKLSRNKIRDFYNSSPEKEKIVFSYFEDYGNFDSMFLPAGIGPIDGRHNTSINGEYVNLSWIVPVDVYNNSWYSIVSETTCSNENNQYTEKVAKPIVAGRPFVAFAGKNYLANLRKLGFKTFDGVIDESYDTIDDLEQRLRQAWHSVESLCNSDPVAVYTELESVLEHNRQHFLSTDWQQPVKNIFDTLK